MNLKSNYNAVLLAIFFVPLFCFGQSDSSFRFKPGINSDYAFSGTTHIFTAGPALFYEKEKAKEDVILHVLYLNPGLYGGKNAYTRPMISIGYYGGRLPGFLFGVSTQQYYKVETKSKKLHTDYRLSFEVIFALFGYIGYRYELPLNEMNESKHRTRHTFVFRIPLSFK
jgi:hypothetical protein